ncbi:MAG: ribosome silencing factor [Spirochaetia bacterium]
MEDTADIKEYVKEIAAIIDDHKGENTTILSLEGQSSWTDFFIITTVQSSARMRGILGYILDYLKEIDMKPKHSMKQDDESGWLLLDCGDFVIHLMSEEARKFYELEKVWFNAETVSYSSSKSS